MSALILVHDRLSVTMLLFTGALALWGFWNYFRGEGVTGSYWGALAVGEGLIVVQGVLGGILYAAGNQPARGVLHILYGIVAVLSIPSAFAFTRGRSGRYEALIYALIALFLLGITTRAQATGGLGG